MTCVPISSRARTRPSCDGSVTTHHHAPGAAGHRPPPALPAFTYAAPLSSWRVGYSIEAKFTYSSSLLFPVCFTHSALPCSPRHRVAPRQAMPLMSHQAKLCRSCCLVIRPQVVRWESTRAPSRRMAASPMPVNLRLSLAPSHPPRAPGRPWEPLRPSWRAPRPPLQPADADSPPLDFTTMDNTRWAPVGSVSASNQSPTATPWPPASHWIRPTPLRTMVPLPPLFCCGAASPSQASPIVGPGRSSSGCQPKCTVAFPIFLRFYLNFQIGSNC
jgi:hypothetical protein